MGAILKIVAGLVGIFDKIFGNQRDNELRKDGARKADLAQRDKVDETRKDAKKHRRDNKSVTKSDAAARLRRNSDKGKH